MAILKMEKKEPKVSLNLKISKSVDERLKRARAEARKQGAIFNVSSHVEEHLQKLLKKVEEELGIKEEKK